MNTPLTHERLVAARMPDTLPEEALRALSPIERAAVEDLCA